MNTADPTFSSAQMREILAVSRRQLGYWAEQGHLEPSARPDGVRASIYSLSDAIRIFFVTELLRFGYSTRKALKLEKMFHWMLTHNGVRVDETLTVLLDRKDRILLIRGTWWPEANVEIAKRVIPYSKLFERLAKAGAIL